jgi:type II secretory pathway predicted ATPase ExeA
MEEEICHLHQVITASWEAARGALVMMVLGKVFSFSTMPARILNTASNGS